MMDLLSIVDIFSFIIQNNICIQLIGSFGAEKLQCNGEVPEKSQVAEEEWRQNAPEFGWAFVYLVQIGEECEVGFHCQISYIIIPIFRCTFLTNHIIHFK